MKLPDYGGYIIIGIQGEKYVGIVENSFSMSLSDTNTQFYWSSDNASSNFGGSFKVDGKKNAERTMKNFAENHSEIKFKIFDVYRHKLPVSIDWDKWREDSIRSEKTLSGVKDKFGNRNPEFSYEKVGLYFNRKVKNKDYKETLTFIEELKIL